MFSTFTSNFVIFLRLWMKDVTLVDKRIRLRGHPCRALCHDNVQTNTVLNGVHATHVFIRLMKFVNGRMKRALLTRKLQRRDVM